VVSTASEWMLLDVEGESPQRNSPTVRIKPSP
jgi:hypothetical protein